MRYACAPQSTRAPSGSGAWRGSKDVIGSCTCHHSSPRGRFYATMAALAGRQPHGPPTYPRTKLTCMCMHTYWESLLSLRTALLLTQSWRGNASRSPTTGTTRGGAPPHVPHREATDSPMASPGRARVTRRAHLVVMYHEAHHTTPHILYMYRCVCTVTPPHTTPTTSLRRVPEGRHYNMQFTAQVSSHWPKLCPVCIHVGVGVGVVCM